MVQEGGVLLRPGYATMQRLMKCGCDISEIYFTSDENQKRKYWQFELVVSSCWGAVQMNHEFMCLVRESGFLQDGLRDGDRPTIPLRQPFE